MKNKEIDYYKNKTDKFIDEGKNQIEKLLVEGGFRLVGKSGKWFQAKEGYEAKMFDYIIPNGHIEFTVMITGWEQSISQEEFSE